MLPHGHHKIRHKKQQQKDNVLLKMCIYTVAIASPLFTIPQIYVIFTNKTAEGVSIISWIAYMVASTVWLMYGLAHNDKPIILSNTAWVFFALLVVIGTIMYS